MLSRASRRLLLAALIVGAPGLFAAAPTAAQTTIWSATLTVDVSDLYRGCNNTVAALDHCSSTTALSDDDLTYEGVTYTIVGLYRFQDVHRNFNIKFAGLSGDKAKAALKSLTLNVDGRKFAFADAQTAGDLDPGNPLVNWPLSQDLGWTDGQKVSLSLTAPPVKLIAPPVKQTRRTATAAWLARFGRTVAAQAVDAVTGRLADGGGSRVTLAGRTLSLDTAQARAAAEIDAAALGADPSDAWSRDRWTRGDDREAAPRTMTGRDLLRGGSFHLQSGGAAGGPAFAAWGRAAHGRFDGKENGLSLDGEVTTGFLGADVSRGRWLAGAAVALSEGEGSWRGGAGDADKGKAESRLTSLLPYARLRLTERVSAWAMLGYGTGELKLTETGGERRKADLTMTLGAAGGRGALVDASEGGGFELALKGDAFRVRTESDAAEGVEGTKTGVTRLRLALDASRPVALEGGGALTPSLEVGLRHDGGDAETGTGAELGAGLGWTDPASGVSAELRGRWLAAHAADGYEEWGVSGAVRVDPGARGRGLSLTLAPTVGAAGSGTGNLRSAADARGLAPGGEFRAERRLDGEVGYGFAGPAGLGTLTPRAGFGLADGDGRVWRAGARWSVAPGASLDLEATRAESADGAVEPEHGVTLRGALRW